VKTSFSHPLCFCEISRAAINTTRINTKLLEPNRRRTKRRKKEEEEEGRRR